MASETDVTTSNSSYDEAPYPAGSHPETHPNRLAAMGRLFGLETVAPSTARVLEIGCADGANLLPMAEMAPGATFVGIDASKVQIETAQRGREAARLKNVELSCQDILRFPLESARFDYIIVHGIFSWVSEEVREQILNICQECLTDNGIAYVSYNAYPGWHMRQSLRDMMLYHTRPFAEPQSKVGQARALLKFLVDSVPQENNSFGTFLKNELDVLGQQPDNYLRHDILEEENAPFYFHEFVERASRHSLQYLSETKIASMLTEGLPADVQETLRRVSPNIIAQEQYMDFLRNRFFRQTLLCRSGIRLKRNLSADLMRQFAFHPHLKHEPAPIDYSPFIKSTFTTNAGQQLSTTDPFVKGLFSVLSDSDSRAITFTTLLAQVRSRIGSLVARNEEEAEVLASNLMKLFGMGAVDICADPVDISLKVLAKPAASLLMRHQAMNSRFITNRIHVGLPGDAFGRLLIEACNGERTIEEIVEVMVDRVREGKIVITEGGVQVLETERVRELVAPRVRQLLQNLARFGVFATR